MSRRLLVLLTALFLLVPAHAEFRSLLILHTNDLHDHLRPDYDGRGGLPYVAGYIAGQRTSRKDILLLDAGDVMEKGDLVAHKTRSQFSYELLARLGYDVVTVGNHDFAYGVEHLKECLALLDGTDVVCANVTDDQDNPLFRASTIREINGIRVGIVGLLTDTDDARVLSWEHTVKTLKAEAARLKEGADLLIALVHLGKRECLALARECPEIGLFIGGHSHEILKEPVGAESGAWITQAGSYGEYVGRVEMEVDPETRQVRYQSAGLVEMDHRAISPDTEMIAMITEREKQVCPEASVVLGRADSGLGVGELARLAARAFARAGGADLGCCHAGVIFRDSLPAGVVDMNAVFRTGGQRGETLIRARLRGESLKRYQEELTREKKGQTTMADAGGNVETDALDPSREYNVIMPKREWTSRLVKVLGKEDVPGAAPVEFTFTDALAGELRAVLQPL